MERDINTSKSPQMGDGKVCDAIDRIECEEKNAELREMKTTRIRIARGNRKRGNEAYEAQGFPGVY